jgi:alkyl hydroperoxide reductase subunit AhpC
LQRSVFDTRLIDRESAVGAIRLNHRGVGRNLNRLLQISDIERDV